MEKRQAPPESQARRKCVLCQPPCLHRLETWEDNSDAMGTCQVPSPPLSLANGCTLQSTYKKGSARGSVKGKEHLTARLPKCTLISESIRVYSLAGVLTEIGCRAGIWGLLTPARHFLLGGSLPQTQPYPPSGRLLSVYPGTDCKCSPYWNWSFSGWSHKKEIGKPPGIANLLWIFRAVTCFP